MSRGLPESGYSLMKGLPIDELQIRQNISAAVGTVYCIWADVCAFFRRFATLNPKLQIKAFLPGFCACKDLAYPASRRL